MATVRELNTILEIYRQDETNAAYYNLKKFEIEPDDIPKNNQAYYIAWGEANEVRFILIHVMGIKPEVLNKIANEAQADAKARIEREKKEIGGVKPFRYA